jgi:uncharacterized membrane protein YvbJ
LVKGDFVIFCHECGHKLSKDAAFCPECGTTVEGRDYQGNSQGGSSNAQQVKESFVSKIKKMSKKQKLFSAIIAGLILFLFIGYQVGSSLTSKENAMENLKTAIVEKDAKELSNLLVSEDPRLEISEKEVKGLLDYMEQNPKKLTEVMENIKKQANYLDGKKPEGKAEEAAAFLEDLAGSSTNSIMNLTKQGKTALFFDSYRFEVVPTYLKLYTNYKGTELYINDKKVATAKEENYQKEFGPFVPGMYKVKAVYKDEYTTLKTEEDISVTDGSGDVDLYLEGESIYIDSNFEDASVFVNGKDTKLTVEEARKFGPVSMDGSMKLHVEKEFPWGTAKSEEIPVTEEESSYELEISGVTDKTKEVIMQNVFDAEKSWFESLTSLDSSKLAGFSEELNSELAEDIKDVKEDKETYVGKGPVLVAFDMDSFEVYEKDGTYSSSVVGNFLWHGDTANSDASPEAIKETKEKEHTEFYTYTLVYNSENKTWLLESIENRYGYEFENEKKFTY